MTFKNNMMIKSTVKVCCLGVLLTSQASYATNGDIRVGLSAIQTGMANAVVANPESSATIFTNPAGLSNLDMDNMRLDLGFALMNPPRSLNGTDSDSNLFFIPTGSLAFKANKKITIGMGFGALAGFGMDVSDAFAAPSNQQFVTTKELLKFAPAVSIRVSDMLSIGGSLDVYSQSLALSTPGFTFAQNRQFGFGATIGGIFKTSNKLQFGFSYTTEGNMSPHEFWLG